MSFKWAPISNKALRSICESEARTNIWEGAVRSSKTVASLIRWVEFIKTAPDGPLLMIGKTERTLKRNILDPLTEILGQNRMRVISGSGEARIFGRLVYLAGANDERAEQKIRGLTLAGAYGDELTLWPESFFRILLSRLSVPGARFFGTTNPDSPYHWLKKQFIDRQSELDLKSWEFRLQDNLSLDPRYIEALSAEYTGLWRRRFIDGDWVVAEGVVYDAFNPELHVFSGDRTYTTTYVGVDYGTTNPTVFLLGGLDEGGRLIVAEEWRYDPAEHGGRQKTDMELAAELKRFVEGRGVRFVFIDPSAASFRLQAHQSLVRGIAPADNSVIDGIRNVSSLLASGRLLIHERCKGLLSEMTAYCWDPAAQMKGEDKPLKVNDHSCDALRYLVRGMRAEWSRMDSRFRDDHSLAPSSERRGNAA